MSERTVEAHVRQILTELDILLAQSAIDRLQSAAHELVLDGESYRRRQKPTISSALIDHPPTGPRSHRRR